MSTVIDTPKPQIFDSVGYFDTRVVGANVKRWVGFPGDLIVPQRKGEISWLEVGGEETSCPCLQKYGRGFVPRGLPALLELGGEPIPMRHLGDLQAVAWSGIPLNEDMARNKFGFVPVYPGDGLRVLRRYALNDGGMRKGMDELTSLQGKEWLECHNAVVYCPSGHYKSESGQSVLSIDKCPTCKEQMEIMPGTGVGILDVIERAMFGDGMSPTLRGLEDQIRHAHIPNSPIDIPKYKDEWLRLCGDFRVWAGRKVSVEHGLLKTGHVGEWQGGWSYSYSTVTEMLLEQLEIPRQDQPLQEMARMVGQMQPKPGISNDQMDLAEIRWERRLAQMEAAHKQEMTALRQQVAGGRGKLVRRNRPARPTGASGTQVSPSVDTEGDHDSEGDDTNEQE